MSAGNQNMQTALGDAPYWTAMALAALVAIASTQQKQNFHHSCHAVDTPRIGTRSIHITPAEDAMLKDMKLHD